MKLRVTIPAFSDIVHNTVFIATLTIVLLAVFDIITVPLLLLPVAYYTMAACFVLRVFGLFLIGWFIACFTRNQH